MSKTVQTFSVDANKLLVKCHKPGPTPSEVWKGAIQMSGDLGGGTFSLFVSYDGGVTQNTLDNISGTAYTTTDLRTIPIEAALDNSNNGDVLIYGTLSGSTSPTLTTTTTDNV